jgi:anti-sigma B factor antagonist
MAISDGLAVATTAKMGIISGLGEDASQKEGPVDNLRLHTQVRRDGRYPVLVVAGEIDVFTAPLFKQAVVNLVAEGHRHLFLDMREVTFMDSSGFGALLGATKRLRPEGGSLNLIGCNRMIQRMLHLTRLDTILGVFPHEEEAMANVQDSPSGSSG